MANQIPGKMPAKKSLVTEIFAVTPKITNPIEGGMMGPITPQAAMRPPLVDLLCPAFTIIGSKSAVSAAASATAEPDNADKIQAAMMVT